jgi:hypothetical protein
MDKTQLLYLPFDNQGEDIAYDFSANRKDAVLSGGATLQKEVAYKLKALALNGSGEAVSAATIPLASDWTLLMDVKSDQDLFWLLNFSGIDNYLTSDIPLSEADDNGWLRLAFIKTDGKFVIWVNGSWLDTYTFTGIPIGFSVNDLNILGSHAYVDQVQLFSRVLTEKEIITGVNYNVQSEDVEYYINERNFKDFGVFVSSSSGLMGRLGRKSSLESDWDDYHGQVIDLAHPRYKERTIELKCFIEALTRSQFVQAVDRFMSEFDKPYTQRFKCEYDGRTMPLVYEVYVKDDVDVTKTWARYNDDLMVGTFTLKIIEPEPVKRVLRWIAADDGTVASIKLTSNRMLDIFWGDGKATYNVHGDNITLTHTYEGSGEYEIIVAGNIEEIEKFSTNAIVLWDKLK